MAIPDPKQAQATVTIPLEMDTASYPCPLCKELLSTGVVATTQKLTDEKCPKCNGSYQRWLQRR